MNLNDVHRGIKKYKKRKRLGRGIGSGHGKTCGRGHKGQRSRAGYSVHPTFEGGQMPLVRRIPKRGFNNRWALKVAIVNLADLEKRFDAGEEVNPETLRAKNLAKGRYDVLKVLAEGELTKGLKVAAHRFSRQAAEKIEKAGGEVRVLPGKAPVVKNKMQQKIRP
ncbi:MAG: 50S ribosomal protein L15 [Candidatus Nealsonbacteria bacterium]|nr:50S ribosomal protein L15 [Candidatus Nealsonbacteria bacterium]